MNYQMVTKSVSQMVLFSIICIGLVSIISKYSDDSINYNKRNFLLQQLNKLVDYYDNDIINDSYSKQINLYGQQSTITIYPAKINNNIVARLIKHNYPAGYSGNITILTAIDNSNEILGVRILEHRETPGLGDKIELAKSNWLLQFNNKSIANTPAKDWFVIKKGGKFDSFSGATITPQAVVTAVYELLNNLDSVNLK